MLSSVMFEIHCMFLFCLVVAHAYSCCSNEAKRIFMDPEKTCSHSIPCLRCVSDCKCFGNEFADGHPDEEGWKGTGRRAGSFDQMSES